MKVSIIIPVYNNLSYTKKCLNSVFEFGSKYKFEVIVVDNASSDGTKEYLENHKQPIIYINNNQNLGFAKACNQGAKIAKGEYLLFLNNDTIVTKNWMDILVSELDNNKKIAIAGSKLLFPDEKIQHAGVAFDKNKEPYHIHYRKNKDSKIVNKKIFFQAVTGACLLIKKQIFDKIKGFDEIYKNGYEDVDLCLKVGELGYLIIYCPESVVYHYESITEGRKDSETENKNLDILLKRWGNKISSDEDKYLEKENFTCQNCQNFQNQLDQKKQQIIILNNKLNYLESSKFWKLRNQYIDLKNKLKKF